MSASNNGGAYLAYLSFDSSEDGDLGDDGGADPNANPILFIQRYGTSDNVTERQVAVRHMLKTLQSLEEAGEGRDRNTAIIFQLIQDFSVDSDPLIRAELVEVLPMLCMHCAESGPPFLRPFLNDALIPLLVNLLTDHNIQVRKTCQAAIFILLEQDLLDKEVLEGTIIPVLSHQCEPEIAADETRIETVSLLCKIVTTSLSAERVVGLFLEQFTRLCQEERLFHIRKQCAGTLGDLARILGAEVTEAVIVPHLVTLSQDSVWGVRKACAENYTLVSQHCAMDTRKRRLAPQFIALLSDASRWVQSSAFQALGPFISTFADAGRTGLAWVDGSLTYTQPENWSPLPAPPSPPPSVPLELPSGLVVPALEVLPPLESPAEANAVASSILKEAALQAPHLQAAEEEEPEEEPTPTSAPSEDGSFNSFLFWRSDSATLVEEAVEAKPSDSGLTCDYLERNLSLRWADAKPEDDDDAGTPKARLADAASVSGVVGRLAALGTSDAPVKRTEVLSSLLDSSDEEPLDTTPTAGDDSHLAVEREKAAEKKLGEAQSPEFEYQDIIPVALLESFVSMATPVKAQNVESEIAKYCAFNLPAVAMTIGRSNWPLLRPTYTLLANDIQWKVRRTLAFSLHELARILGPELTRADLLPVFSSFMRDLDEVRIGILRHLDILVELLGPETRRDVLGSLGEFIQTDNARNWRFRLQLAKQLTQLCPLYRPADINEYLSPIAMTLATDRVAEIRGEAYGVLATILAHFAAAEAGAPARPLTDGLVQDIIRSFARSKKYVRRQSYAYICVSLLASGAELPASLVPPLVELGSDPIPNVRIVALKALDPGRLDAAGLPALLKRLAEEDTDGDVRRACRARLGIPEPRPKPAEETMADFMNACRESDAKTEAAAQAAAESVEAVAMGGLDNDAFASDDADDQAETLEELAAEAADEVPELPVEEEDAAEPIPAPEPPPQNVASSPPAQPKLGGSAKRKRKNKGKKGGAASATSPEEKKPEAEEKPMVPTLELEADESEA